MGTEATFAVAMGRSSLTPGKILKKGKEDSLIFSGKSSQTHPMVTPSNQSSWQSNLTITCGVLLYDKGDIAD